jgi:tRNA pseudouridine32 synthase/23S rRNA pseudouridine746 synthase
LFEQFKVLNAKGKEKSLLDIFAEHSGIVPPGGAGECAAPKLLQYAYLNSLTPIAVAEFWVGESPLGEVRRDGCFYGACKSKCEPILGYMLQGLDIEDNALEKGGDISNIGIVYEDDYIVVVNKPSGVLSVPGIMGGTSVQQWLRDEYLHSNELFVVHRLDMATSGLLVAAKSMDAYKELQRQFAGREVKKQYTAILDGMPQKSEGVIELPLAADYDNRPRQKVDYLNGKPAITRYKIIGAVERNGRQCAVVCFEPITGRTHQLRVHAAHKEGLDCPIVGDALYGTLNERLMLHASCISFVHPVDKELVTFETELSI